MLTWIFAGLLVYTIGLFLPSLFLIPKIGVPAYAGSRDNEPDASGLHGRAKRAHQNFMDTLPIFLAFGVAAMTMNSVDIATALLGAKLYVLARAFYLPLYLMAVPWLRSIVWSVGALGLVLMGYALI